MRAKIQRTLVLILTITLLVSYLLKPLTIPSFSAFVSLRNIITYPHVFSHNMLITRGYT